MLFLVSAIAGGILIEIRGRKYAEHRCPLQFRDADYFEVPLRCTTVGSLLPCPQLMTGCTGGTRRQQ